MKILLIGEYSNVHWSLAEGLRALGHNVCVISNGDFWKDYRRDISLVRHYTKLGGLRYMLRLYSILPKLRGYDIVQLINPMFLELKAEMIAPIFSTRTRSSTPNSTTMRRHLSRAMPPYIATARGKVPRRPTAPRISRQGALTTSSPSSRK